MFRFDICWDLGKMRACCISMNPLNPNPAKWSNILKQFIGNRVTELKDFDYLMAKRRMVEAK